MIGFGVHDGTTGTGICGATTDADDAWHHVAVTRTVATGALAIWVDGALDGSGAGPTSNLSYRDGRSTGFPNDPYLALGAEKHDAGPAYPSYDGFLDELRFSTVVRYTAAFIPPATPFATDGATATTHASVPASAPLACPPRSAALRLEFAAVVCDLAPANAAINHGLRYVEIEVNKGLLRGEVSIAGVAAKVTSALRTLI